MSWTATTQDPLFIDDFIRIPVIFTDGRAVVSLPFDVRSSDGFADLPRRITEKRDQIAALYDAVKTFIPGVVDFTPPPPTQQEIDRAAFTSQCQQLRDMKAALEAARAAGATSRFKPEDVDTLSAQIKLAYREEYADLVRGLF